MLNQAVKENLNQISITGVRAIVLIGLLISAPRTLEEIKNILIDLKILESKSSNDILRIDLNTLKLMGCKIPRASKSNNYRYSLEDHPFQIKINPEELKALKKVYKIFKKDADISSLIEFDGLLKKIGEQINDTDVREALLGISILKKVNIETVKELEIACQKKRNLIIEYCSPTAGKHSHIKEIAVQKIVLNNDKLYLQCYDLKKKLQLMLNLQRIKGIIAKNITSDNVEVITTNVRFLLKNTYSDKLDENEIVLSSNKDGIIVEGYYYNEFYATQRILSFGEHCTIIEPLEFKEHIVSLLKEIKKLYE